MQYLKWVSVDDRLPDAELQEYKRRFPDEHEMGVIVMIKDACVPYHLYYDGERFCYTRYDENEYDVTHWMELPPAPKDCMVTPDLGDDFIPCYEELMAIYN
jgi:hypothetical protein